MGQNGYKKVYLLYSGSPHMPARWYLVIFSGRWNRPGSLNDSLPKLTHSKLWCEQEIHFCFKSLKLGIHMLQQVALLNYDTILYFEDDLPLCVILNHLVHLLVYVNVSSTRIEVSWCVLFLFESLVPSMVPRTCKYLTIWWMNEWMHAWCPTLWGFPISL